MAETNCTSTICSSFSTAEAESDKVLFPENVCFLCYHTPSSTVISANYDYFVILYLKPCKHEHIYTWVPSYRYLAYIIILVVHPPLLSKQGRLCKGGQKFRWKLGLIWNCPKWQKSSFLSKLCSIDLTRLDYYVFELTRNFICTNIFATEAKSQSKKTTFGWCDCWSHLNRSDVQNINVSVCLRWTTEDSH